MILASPRRCPDALACSWGCLVGGPRLWEEASGPSVGLGHRLVCELTSLFEKLVRALMLSDDPAFHFRGRAMVPAFLFENLARARLLPDDPAFRASVGAILLAFMFERLVRALLLSYDPAYVVRRLFSYLKRMRPCDTLVSLCPFLFYRQACVLPS